MNKPLVSIIVPIYNAEEFLVRCLESLVNQSLKNIEIILIDDGSTDTSLKICTKYAAIDKRIKLISQQNLGVSVARNVGIENSKADYIAFMDPDDDIDNKIYELLYKNIEENHTDFVMCNYYKCIKDMRIPIILDYSKTLNEDKEILILISNMLMNKKYGDPTIMGCVWRGLFKKEIIQKNNITFKRDIRPRQDLIFLIEYLLNCSNVFINKELLYYYYVNPNSAVTGYKKGLWENNKKVFFIIKDLLDSYNLKKHYNKELSNFLVLCAEEAIHNEVNERNVQSKKMKIENIKKIISDTHVKASLNDVSLKYINIKKKNILFLMSLGNATIIFNYLTFTKKLRVFIRNSA